MRHAGSVTIPAPAAPTPAAHTRARRTPLGGPLIIGHRGAAGYRPEHTLASYELAARLGADYLEPDLVSTADGVLVARHEPEIGGTTDVARHPEFSSRRTTKVIDGRRVHGWFVEDFTLTELRTLRARERIPNVRRGNTHYDGHFPVPTFEEVLTLAADLSRQLGRTIGVYPETKSPSYFAALGLALEPPLIAALRAAGLDRRDAPVFVQSFETGNLRELAGLTPVQLVQLIDSSGAPYDLMVAGADCDYRDLLAPDGMAAVAVYAHAIGPHKDLLIAADGVETGAVADAHAEGLAVHAFTFRNENRFLPADLRSTGGPNEPGDALGEVLRFVRAGVDGLFCDHPDTAVSARAA
jgi:glycerophosphoryl diester phosphodiesterase